METDIYSEYVVALRTETVPTRIEPTTFGHHRLNFLQLKATKLLVTKVILIFKCPPVPRQHRERGTLSSRSK